MPDTQRSKATLLTSLFQDGQSGGITAQDIRDLIKSFAPDFAGLYFTVSASTTISVAGTYVKAAGTTVITNESSSMNNGGVNNRLVYLGPSMRHYHIVLQASVSLVSGANQDISLGLYKWDDSAGTGSILAHSEAHTTIPNNALMQITSHADTMLDTNDYIELHITNNSATNDIAVDYGYLFGISMIM